MYLRIYKRNLKKNWKRKDFFWKNKKKSIIKKDKGMVDLFSFKIFYGHKAFEMILARPKCIFHKKKEKKKEA